MLTVRDPTGVLVKTKKGRHNYEFQKKKISKLLFDHFFHQIFIKCRINARSYAKLWGRVSE